MSSTRLVYCVICDASVMAPIAAAPIDRAARVSGTWNISTVLTDPTNNGHENVAYSRRAPRSYRKRSLYGEYATAIAAPTTDPARVPITSDQKPTPARASVTVTTK